MCIDNEKKSKNTQNKLLPVSCASQYNDNHTLPIRTCILWLKYIHTSVDQAQ